MLEADTVQPRRRLTAGAKWLGMFDHPDLPDQPDEPWPHRSIRLVYQMGFHLPCIPSMAGHEDHPEKVKFARGALLGAEVDPGSGDAIVTGVFGDHRFRFLRGQYEATR